MLMMTVIMRPIRCRLRSCVVHRTRSISETQSTCLERSVHLRQDKQTCEFESLLIGVYWKSAVFYAPGLSELAT